MNNSIFKTARVVLTGIAVFAITGIYGQWQTIEQVRNDFKALLKRPSVALHPSFQTIVTDSVKIEKGFFYAEATEKVPVLIYKPLSAGTKKWPVVICLHGTGGSMDGMRSLLYRFSQAGFMAVAIDGRYHGERKTADGNKNEYVAAIIRAWEDTNRVHPQHPFFFDTVYDTWKLVDYLLTRTDVDGSRIGMMGISKGGIETWMGASVDTRIKVAVPVIAVQSFNWSLENDRWQGRAKTIWDAHVQVAKDLGDTAVTKESVRALWNKLIPGITGEFDGPSMIRLFAPRPLLILNTEKDPNCPLPGAQLAFDAATRTYQSQNAPDKLKIDVEPNEPHRFTPKHMDMTIAWFTKWL